MFPIQFPWKSFFYDFFDVSQLSYKPSNFARANKPYAMGSRVKVMEKKSNEKGMINVLILEFLTL